MNPNYLDVVWLTICGILVFIMQAGFLCLEAGFTRSKNRINVVVKNLTDLGLSVLIFWAIGYGLMFGSSFSGSIGIDRFLPNLGDSKDMWTGSFFLFQAMFCSTAVTIISGATAERMQFRGYLAIAAITSGLVYPIFGHWVWQGIDQALPLGWLAQQGFVDFAGGTVVHSLGGWCSLAIILVVGPRIGRFSAKRRFDTMSSTDIPIAFLGTMLLWFGWFGFNGGSNLLFDAHVSNITANTLVSGAAGAITPIAVMALRQRPIEVAPIMNGALAGLVSVTAGCHAFSSSGALLVGSVGSLLMMATVSLLSKCKIDDAVGAIPVHLAGGIWGTLAVGFFGNLTRLGTDLTRFEQIQAQTSGILACGLWAFSISLVGALVLGRFNLLRVSPREEFVGLNISEHNTRSAADDVFSVMRHHAKTGDFERRVGGEAFTEVGRVGQWYNQVVVALEMVVAANNAIVSSAIDGILTVSDRTLEIERANPASGKIFGQSTDELIGKPLCHLLEITSEQLERDIQTIIQAEEPKKLIGRHVSGQLLPIEVMAAETPIGAARFFTIFIKDISTRQAAEDALIETRAQERTRAIALEQSLVQLKRTQAQLIQRERIAGQGQLVAGIAYEINSPADFIHSNTERARQYIQDLLSAIEAYQQQSVRLPVEVRSHLEDQLEELDIDYIQSDYPKLFSSIQTGTARIRTIIKKLRNFSRCDESDVKLIDLNTSIDKSLLVIGHRLSKTSRRGQIKVTKHYRKLPSVECYASAVNRAILNILINAIDAFDRLADEAAVQGKPTDAISPRITIKTQANRNRVFVTISNNGPYISEADQKKLFDPFFTTQPVGKGTGLGCTISYQTIVEQHHGQLTCHSTKGKDTIFIIELPRQQSTAKLQSKIVKKLAKMSV